MKVLVLYYHFSNDRNTINEHLFSFQRYSKHEFYYADVSRRVNPFILSIEYDVIIFHYTLISIKDQGRKTFLNLLKRVNRIIKSKAYKIAFPQDEYTQSDLVCEMAKMFGVKTIFTCLPSSDWAKVYPFDKSGVKDFVQVFPGYVDENMLKGIEYTPHAERIIDVGYRARKVPYWLGYHGIQKWKLTDMFRKELQSTSLNYDISNNINLVFYGKGWIEFLSKCRCVLGCEGGSSLLDEDGKIRKKIDGYVFKHPKATFEMVKNRFIKKLDGNLSLFALSPRHFDASMTRTCQVLMEGSYGGIFKPGRNYIEVKKDYSNIKDVIAKMSDVPYCEKLAENTYKDIVLSGKYTYSRFVSSVFEHIKPNLNHGEITVRQLFNVAVYNASVLTWLTGRFIFVSLLVLAKLLLLNKFYRLFKKINKFTIHMFVKIKGYYHFDR